MFSLYELGEFDQLSEQIERARYLIERLGARHFEAINFLYSGLTVLARGRRTEARRLLDKGVAIARATGVYFMGASLLGALAWAVDDAAIREHALSEGEMLLREGGLGHNYFGFYRHAIEAALGIQDWDGAERHAAALEAYTRPEPVPLMEFVIARGHALARHGRGSRRKTRDELQRLIAEAEQVGLKTELLTLRMAFNQGQTAGP